MFVLLLVLLVPFAVGVATALDALGVPEATGEVMFGCLVIPSVIAVAYWEWKTGFYALREGGEGRT